MSGSLGVDLGFGSEKYELHAALVVNESDPLPGRGADPPGDVRSWRRAQPPRALAG